MWHDLFLRGFVVGAAVLAGALPLARHALIAWRDRARLRHPGTFEGSMARWGHVLQRGGRDE